MAHKFVVGIRGKIPYLIEGDEWIVTDNDDYTLELVPDSEWDEFPAKTVLYIYDNGKCILHPITGNTDTIPVVQHSGRLHIGVTAGEIRTTTWVTIPIKSSARRKGRVEIPEPEPEVYDQIMEAVNQAAGRGVSKFYINKGYRTDGDTPYFIQMNLKDGTLYRLQLPTQATAIHADTREPTGDDPGAGAYNSPFWLDKSTGFLYNYVRQHPINVRSAMWQQVRGRPQVTSGEGKPTTSTVGEKDDLYVNSSTMRLYWCSGWEYSGDVSEKKTYHWEEITAMSRINIDSGSGDGDSSGTTALKASYDEDTGELVVSGGTVTFDESTGEMTIDGTPMSFDEETGELNIGG